MGNTTKKGKVTTKITPTIPQEPETGIDTNKTIIDNIISGTQVGGIDLSSIDALSNSAQNREQTYELLDAMTQDDVISAVLETYAEDTVQTNDKGQTIWIESSDSNVLNYTTWLLDSLNVDKHLYQWAYCLVTYGDCYIRLYRKSDYGNELLFKNNRHNRRLNEATESKDPINEDVMLRVYAEDDPYIPYVEMVPNPAEMFDLQKFGKSYGYIKAPVRMIQQTTDQLYNYLTRYKMKQRDVEIFDATSFVHACIENTGQRQPETVDIFLDDINKPEDDYNFTDDENDVKDSMTTSYSIKRGQSILYNAFRIWRELNLLEMSAILNRLTQSSVVRIINVNTGDMPKEQVENFMRRLKEKIEQKSSVDAGVSMAEYNNTGPIINTIYIPTHGDQGSLSVTTLGGDFDPKSLTDIEYFRDKLFGALKVPKQFFGFTEDGAGFNGGTSLTIIDARYGKTIKKLQNILCQMVTDIINLFLIDRGLNNYVNKFQVRMEPPVTQVDLDRRTNTDNRIRYIGDIMNQITGLIDDTSTKLTIYKSLISSCINDAEVISIIQGYIDKLNKPEGTDEKESKESSVVPNDNDFGNEPEPEPELPSMDEIQNEEVEKDDKEVLTEKTTDDATEEDDSYLPSPDDLGVDCTERKD